VEGGATSMSALVTALQSILTTDAMFTNLSALIPVVGGVLIFAFTYRIVRRIVSGASKGKARV
jgi:asparagine N-glycosylation enzyme membrane subunit Stt3